MNKTKRKDYILYVDFRNISIPIMKGTLNEIDGFTTCFESYDAFAKLFLKDFAKEGIDYSFYIETSRGSRYSILLNDSRFILSEFNKHSIIQYLLSLELEDLIMYIENNTKIFEYLESDRKDFIPLNHLYKLLLENNPNYVIQFENMLKNDYNFYRNIAAFYRKQMPKLVPESIIKDKKEEIRNLSYKIYMDISNKINTTRSNESINIIDSYNIDSKILDIIRNNDEIDDIVTEISFIISDEEERRKYLEEYFPLIYEKQANGKINR